MNVAWIVPGGVDRSGTHRVIPALLWLLERVAREHRVTVIALAQEPDPGEWDLLGARVLNIGGGLRRLRAARRLLAEHRRAPFDVVHAFWAIGPGAIGAGLRALTRVPLIVQVMGGELVSLPGIGYGGSRTARGRAELRWALGSATVRCAGARGLRDEVAALAGPTELVPLGVDRSAWSPIAPRRRAAGAPLRLVHVASLNRVKDQTTLLRACALLAQHDVAFSLDIIGEDTLGGAIQRLAASLGLSAIRFHGFLPQHDAQPIVAAADLFVLSSRHDAAPVAVLEAAMAGVPTVGTRVGHVADLAPAAAVAVPAADPAALAAAIAELASDEERRLALAGAAQDWARRHDAEFTFTAVNAIYRRLAARA